MRKSLTLLLGLLLSIQFCGCQSLPTAPAQVEDETVELTLVIPKDSSSILREVAQELARRAEDFAGNSLTITVEEKNNLWKVAENGSADLLLCENSRLLESAEKLGELVYPAEPEIVEQTELTVEATFQTLEEVSGGAAMLAMLEYPYFFRDSECVLGGGNDPEFLAALNHSFPEDMEMKLKRISYSGCYHWLTGDGAALEEYLKDKDSDAVLQGQLSAGASIRDPWGNLGDSQLYVKEVDLSESDTDLTEKTLLLSGARQKLLDIFILPESLTDLSEQQQAALEEAIVYSGGYSRTLADDQQKMTLEQLRGAGVSIVEIDVDRWYETFQGLYRKGDHEVSEELADLLWEKTECYH